LRCARTPRHDPPGAAAIKTHSATGGRRRRGGRIDVSG
jgi:hypothetical protein